MSAGAVRAGGVFVEIGADPRKFFSALNKVNKSLASMGGQLVSGGGKLAAAGVGMAAPIVAAVRQGAAFESTLLNIRASTGATAAEINKIRDASMQMSQALGVGPTEAAGGMLELLKAGMSLDTVLGGAGKTAMEFAKVGEMDVGQAAVVMSDAMNVFKVSADVAANALSSAADASSTSIAQMSEAFSMSSAVAGLANQSIGDLSAALAILANNGVKGSDAGTSVKTMLMRLMAPADDAVGALQQLGLTVGSFRGADGQMLPMVEIIRLLNDEMQGLDQTAKDDIFRRLFGADAIRAASILASAGVEGFTSMQDAMSSALPVGEKYKVLMSGLAGAGGSILAAMQRLAISISDAVTPALAGVVPFITGFIDGLTDFASKNGEAVAGFAKLAVGAVALGGSLTGLGLSLQITAFAMGGLTKAIALVVSPIASLASLAFAASSSLVGVTVGVFAVSKAFFEAAAYGVWFASTALAMSISYYASLSSMVAATVASTVAIAGYWVSTAATAVASFAASAAAAVPAYIAAVASYASATVSAAASIAAAWFGVAAQSLVSFVGGAVVAVSAYVAQLALAVSTTVVSTAAIAAAWIADISAVVAILAGAAVSALTSYVAGIATAAASSISYAAAIAAAWLAPIAPIVAIGAAVSGVAVLVSNFGGAADSAFSGLSSLAGSAASAISDNLSGSVSDGIVVFGDLFRVGKETFNGIYEAIAAGDLASAMDILWAGLVAGWLRGVEALMSYVDPWVAAFQDVFTDIGSGIVIAWDKIYTDSAALLNTMGAFIMGFFDNIANGVMATFDSLVGAIQIAWTRVQGFITGAKDTEERVQAIKDENAARAEQRRQERPGVEGRTAKAEKENARAERDRQDRARGIKEDAQAAKEARQAENAARADERRAATQAAEENVGATTRRGRAKRVMDDQYSQLLKDVESATSLDQLRDLYGQFEALSSNGRLTSGQIDILDNAITDAQERIGRATSSMGASPSEKAATAGAEAAGAQSVQSMGQVAGTFSSLNLGSVFGGTSLAERTARAAEETAKNTRKIDDGGKVAA